MNSVSVEPTKNGISIESMANAVTVELVDILTIYYYLHPAQILPEHREVTA